MNELLRQMRDLIESLTRQGKTQKQIEQRIKRLLEDPKLFPDVRNMNAEQFVRQFGVSEQQQSVLLDRIAPIVSQAESESKRFKQSVLTAVQSGLRSAAKQGLEGDFRAFAREALRPTIVNANHLNAEIETAQAALDRAGTVESARNAGELWFRYVGPAGNARKFCTQHVGRIYNISEIEAMNNGQGLSVLYYMGGYHCRHQWVSVTNAEAQAERPDFLKFNTKGAV